MALMAKMESHGGEIYTYITRTMSYDEFLRGIDYFYLEQEVNVEMVNESQINIQVIQSPTQTYYMELQPGASDTPNLRLASLDVFSQYVAGE